MPVIGHSGSVDGDRHQPRLSPSISRVRTDTNAFGFGPDKGANERKGEGKGTSEAEHEEVGLMFAAVLPHGRCSVPENQASSLRHAIC